MTGAPIREASPRRPPRRYTPLVRRVAALNAGVLVVTCALTIVILAPATFTSAAIEEAIVLVLALAGIAAVNFVGLRRGFAPLERVTRLARAVDPERPGQRVPVERNESEATELAVAFNDMLERLEDERRESTRRVLAAQEAERLRVARELHDEVGQTLTAVLLGLGHAAKRAPAALEHELRETQEMARASLEDVRRIAQELRPEALDDLGLASALDSLAERLESRSGLTVRRVLAGDVPGLGSDAELVVYRVAQEALTNVVRHSGSAHAELRFEYGDGRAQLSVRDEGQGFDAGPAPVHGGLRGMRERAALVGATLAVRSAPGGTEVRLDLPLDDGHG